MNTLPQIAPMSDIRLHQGETLEKIKNGPLLLVERGVKPAAVLVSPEQWDATDRLIIDLQEQLKRERRLRLSNQRYAARIADPTRGVTQQEFDKHFTEAGLL
jgi:PHD/YefM family antitoxin component YafN of YafNO toxin-antitoxin module